MPALRTADLRRPWALLASPRPWAASLYLLLAAVGGLVTLTSFATVLLIPVLLVAWPRVEQRILPLAGHRTPVVRRATRFELRWRDWALVLLSPVLGLGGAAVLAVGLVLPVLMILSPLRRSAAGEEVSVLFLTVESASAQVGAVLGGTALLGLGLWLVCAVSFGWGRITSALLSDEEARLAQQVTALSEQSVHAADRLALERRELERALHDGVQMHLGAAGMRLGMLHLEIDTLQEERQRQRLLTGLGEVRDQLDAASAAVRATAQGLVPETLRDGGLAAALEALASSTPLPTTLRGTAPRLHPEGEIALYFITTEAIANTLRHAEAESITVEVAADAEQVTLMISDDGAGGAEPTGSGLLGIHARARLLGGTAAVNSPSGQGTRILVRIPASASAPGHQLQGQEAIA